MMSIINDKRFPPLLRFIILVILCLSVHPCIDAETAEELVKRCIAREKTITSGHIEFYYSLPQLTTLEKEGEAYYEWNTTKQYRIGFCNSQKAPIVTFNGEYLQLQDGTQYFGDSALNLLASPLMDEKELASLKDANIFSGLCKISLLHPLEYFTIVHKKTIHYQDYNAPVTSELPLENERLIQITKNENVKDADETTAVLRIDTEKALVRAWGYIQEPEKKLIWRYRWRNEVQLNDIWIPCEMSVEAYQDQPAYSMRLFPERSMLGPVDPEGFQFPLNATYQKLELARKQRADIQRAKNWVITVIDTISKSVTYYVICGILVFLGMLYLWRQKVKKNTIIENLSLSKD